MRAVLVTLLSGVLLGSAMAEPAPSNPVVITTSPAGVVSARHFLHTNVEGPNGQYVGRIDDVLYTQEGIIFAYVIELSGFLGIGAKFVALPPTAFEFLTEKDKLKIPYTKAQLVAAQEYTPPKPR